MSSKHRTALTFVAFLSTIFSSSAVLAQGYQGREVNGLWTGTVTYGGEANSATVTIERLGMDVSSTWKVVAGPFSRTVLNMQAAGKLNTAGTELAFDSQALALEPDVTCTLQITAAVASAKNDGAVGRFTALQMTGEGVLAGSGCGVAAGRKVAFELSQTTTL